MRAANPLSVSLSLDRERGAVATAKISLYLRESSDSKRSPLQNLLRSYYELGSV
jgi:hypothetical protein